MPVARPAGIEKRAIALRKPSGRQGPVRRREREEERGHADRERRRERELPRQQREDAAGQRDRHEQERGEQRLRDEQPRDPLDVAQDLAALVDHPRHLAELAGDEHEVGDRAGHLRAAALGDRQPRLLERGDVVDAVAEHRRRSRPTRRGPARPAPCPRARCGRSRARPAPRRSSASSPSGSAPPSSAADSAGMPASRAIAPTVAGLSPDTTFSPTSSAAKNATVSPAFARSRSASTTTPSGRSGWGSGASGAAGGSGASAAASASTRRPAAASSAARPRSAVVAVAGEQRLGRAEDEPLAVRARARSSAAARRTGPAPTAPRAASSPASPASWTASSVALRDGELAANTPSDRASSSLVDLAGGHELDDAQRRLGQRPGLVRAQHRDRRERLDRVELLREHAAAGHLRRRDRGGERHEQDQPLGDDVHDRRRQRLDRLRLADVADRERDASATPSGTITDDEDDEQPVHRLLERRAGMAEGLAPSPPAGRRGCRRRPRSPRSVPAPSTAKEPDSTGSPTPRTTGSDSPVRFDSSSASPSTCRSVPSATIWSPLCARTTSPATTSSIGISRAARRRG